MLSINYPNFDKLSIVHDFVWLVIMNKGIRWQKVMLRIMQKYT